MLKIKLKIRKINFSFHRRRLKRERWYKVHFKKLNSFVVEILITNSLLTFSFRYAWGFALFSVYNLFDFQQSLMHDVLIKFKVLIFCLCDCTYIFRFMKCKQYCLNVPFILDFCCFKSYKIYKYGYFSTFTKRTAAMVNKDSLN